MTKMNEGKSMLKRIVMLYFSVAGLLVQLYTIYYAFKVSGIIAAVLSAVLPVLSNIYWMYEISTDSGNIFNNYNLACGSIVFAYIILLVFTDAGSENLES